MAHRSTDPSGRPAAASASATTLAAPWTSPAVYTLGSMMPSAPARTAAVTSSLKNSLSGEFTLTTRSRCCQSVSPNTRAVVSRATCFCVSCTPSSHSIRQTSASDAAALRTFDSLSPGVIRIDRRRRKARSSSERFGPSADRSRVLMVPSGVQAQLLRAFGRDANLQGPESPGRTGEPALQFTGHEQAVTRPQFEALSVPEVKGHRAGQAIPDLSLAPAGAPIGRLSRRRHRADDRAHPVAGRLAHPKVINVEAAVPVAAPLLLLFGADGRPHGRLTDAASLKSRIDHGSLARNGADRCGQGYLAAGEVLRQSQLVVGSVSGQEHSFANRPPVRFPGLERDLRPAFNGEQQLANAFVYMPAG